MATAVVAPWRVTVGLEPFVLRSAVHAALLADGRFDVLLCPAGEDPLAYGACRRATAVLVSRPVASSAVLAVVVASDDRLPAVFDNLADRLTEFDVHLARDSNDPQERS